MFRPLREVHYEGQIHRNIAEVLVQCTDIKYKILKIIHGLKYILKIKSLICITKDGCIEI